MSCVRSNHDDEKKNVEHFTPTTSSNIGRNIYAVVHFVLALFAIYLSFKCNGGFRLGPFLVALFCPYIYIIYIFATRGGFCGSGSTTSSGTTTSTNGTVIRL